MCSDYILPDFETDKRLKTKKQYKLRKVGSKSVLQLSLNVEPRHDITVIKELIKPQKFSILKPDLKEYESMIKGGSVSLFTAIT